MKLIWYSFHVADYARDTAHLSMLEHGAYRLLLDHYYMTGEPLPANAEQLHRICRAVADAEQHAVQVVVEQFFELTDNGWAHERVEAELAEARRLSEKRRQAAALSHAKRKGSGAQTTARASASADANAEQVQVQLHTQSQSHISIPNGIDKRGKRFDPLNIDLPEGISPATWGNWIAYRRERKLTIAETTIKAQVNKLMKWHNEGHDANAVIEQSIANGWQGLFEPKNQTTQPQRTMNNGRTDERLRVAEAIFGSSAPTPPRPINGTGNVIEATATRVISG